MKDFSHNINLDRRSFLLGMAGVGTALAASSLPFLTGCTPISADEKDDSLNSSVETFDIIIVGAGGAGMNAAISAHDLGAKVLLLEKMTVVGGNTNYAEVGMNASETAVQAKEGVTDSKELFAQETFEGGRKMANIELVNFLCYNSNAAIERLNDRGMPLTKLGITGGMSVPRAHRPGDGSAVGAYFVQHLAALCSQKGIGALTDADVKEILVENGKVVGVKVVNDGKTQMYFAPAIILTTGGFGANHKKLAEYRPELIDAVTTNQPGTQGDGIAMAEAIGAATVDMKEIQVHPTVEQGSATLLSEGIRGDGAILVNAEGNRFIDELKTRDVVSAAEWEQTDGFAYAIFDHTTYLGNPSIENKFVKNDLVLIGNTFEELSEKMGADKENFLDTMTAYNSAIKDNKPDPFGRASARLLIEKAPYYAVKIAPGIHHTMGGLCIDIQTRVLNANGEPIPGLFAAGEVTGGIHGGNRIG
ncbi:MAG: flavocytochrome c, partial [Eggerthellaceae bacterium]|nr:flavocytochrome c [Eggerthellaceae bacterium]